MSFIIVLIMGDDTRKRARKANFSAEEVSLLMEEISEKYEALVNTFNPNMTLKKIKKIWLDISLVQINHVTESILKYDC